jgi:hypothetical protein
MVQQRATLFFLKKGGFRFFFISAFDPVIERKEVGQQNIPGFITICSRYSQQSFLKSEVESEKNDIFETKMGR